MSEYTRKFRLKGGKVVTRTFVVGEKPKAESPPVKKEDPPKK